jgi:hypothetical protein
MTNNLIPQQFPSRNDLFHSEDKQKEEIERDNGRIELIYTKSKKVLIQNH